MSDSQPLRSPAARGGGSPDAVVRPLSQAAERACVRPGCPAPARATLSFRYGSREAWLERLTEEPRPETYDLCAAHAARTRPPHGWHLRDRRPAEERHAGAPPAAPEDLGGERTVALLAAALRSLPQDRPVPTDEVAHEDVGTGSLEDATSPVLEPSRPEAAPHADPAHAATAPRPPEPEPELHDRPRPGGDAEPARAVPRPVPASRRRGGDAERGRAAGPARDW